MEKTDLIIALHGFLGKPQDWHFQLNNYRTTTTTCQIIAPSFFTEGEWSPRKNITEWGEFFLDQCRQWLQQGYNLKLYGYSLGGRLALGPYLKNPELFTEAHFLSVNPGLQNTDEAGLRKTNDYLWANRFLTEPWSSVIKDWNAQSVFIGDYEPERTEGDFNRDLLALALREWSLCHQDNYWQKLINLKAKPNWWVGQKDQKFMAIAQKLKQANININLNIVPNCGHRLLFSNSQFLEQFSRRQP